MGSEQLYIRTDIQRLSVGRMRQPVSRGPGVLITRHTNRLKAGNAEFRKASTVVKKPTRDTEPFSLEQRSRRFQVSRCSVGGGLSPSVHSPPSDSPEPNKERAVTTKSVRKMMRTIPDQGPINGSLSHRGQRKIYPLEIS